MILSVFKFSAAGNIFVLVDLKNPANKTIRANAQPKLAQWLSREFATDGIIFLTQNSKLGAAPVAPQVPRALRSAKTQNLVMVFYNPDGSRAFCGNGTRTSGFYQLRFVEKRREGLVTVTTDAGLIPVAVDGNRATLLEVDTPKYLSSVKLDFSLNSSLKHATCNMQRFTRYGPAPTTLSRLWRMSTLLTWRMLVDQYAIMTRSRQKEPTRILFKRWVVVNWMFEPMSAAWNAKPPLAAAGC